MKILDLFRSNKKKPESPEREPWESDRRYTSKTDGFCETASRKLSELLKRSVAVKRTDRFDDHDFYDVTVTLKQHDDTTLISRILQKPILLTFEELGTDNKIEQVDITPTAITFFVVAKQK